MKSIATTFSRSEEQFQNASTDESHLQLVIRLMNRLSAASGLDQIFESLLKSVGEIFDCTSPCLYCRIDDGFYYADASGCRRRVDSVDDDMLKRVLESRQSVEQEQPSDSFSRFPNAHIWGVPLMVGEELIGVIKMECPCPAMHELSDYLATFFNHAALVLKNEIRGQTRLQKAYDRLEQEMVTRRKAEESLRQAHERLRRLVDSNIVGFLVADASGRVHEANDYYLNLLGYTREELEQGKVNWRAVTPPEWQAPSEQSMRELHEQGTCTPFEKEYFRRDGTRVRVFLTNAMLPGLEKQFIAFVLDITKRKHAEEDLREGEEKFRQMTTTARDAIVMLDNEGKTTFWNKAAEEMLGYSYNDIAGRELHLWLAPERFHDAYRKGFQHFQNTGEGATVGKTLEFVARRKDGVEIPVELSLSSVKLKGKWHAIGIMRGIAERKRAEAELNQERDLLRSLMDHSNDAIYFKDRESRFIRCSSRMAKIFQVQNSGELIGKRDCDFFSKEHAQAAFEDEQLIIRTGEPIMGKVEKETWPDGHVTWVLTSKMLLRNETGEVVGTFGISKDITAIKEAEEKVNTLHRQLVEASRQAGMAEVATSVLHNVGNVLNSVNVSSSLIAEKVGKSKISSLSKVVALLEAQGGNLPEFFANNPKGRQLPGYLAGLATRLTEEQEEILHEVGTLAGNIQHIKEVVAMQQSCAKTLGMTETLPVADMVEDALRLNLGALERHGVKLLREYSPVPPVLVEKHKVLQILVNLIRNAKYACDDSGRADKQITLRIFNGEGRVKIAVKDNGVGIAPENLTRIFNHGFTTRKEGHGFGLHSGALSAKDLGGSLTAFSEGADRGAVFTLELPVKSTKANL